MKLTVPPDRRSKSMSGVLLSVISLISSSAFYILPREFSNSGLLIDKTSSIHLYVKLNRDVVSSHREQILF